MANLPQLDAFIGGKTVASGGKTVPLVSPVDLKPYADMVECPEATVGAAVDNAHAAYMANRRSTMLNIRSGLPLIRMNGPANIPPMSAQLIQVRQRYHFPAGCLA